MKGVGFVGGVRERGGGGREEGGGEDGGEEGEGERRERSEAEKKQHQRWEQENVEKKEKNKKCVHSGRSRLNFGRRATVPSRPGLSWWGAFGPVPSRSRPVPTPHCATRPVVAEDVERTATTEPSAGKQ